MTLYSLPTLPDDPLEANGQRVISFASHYVNNRNKAGRKMSEQWADMTMAEIRDLWKDGAWRHYRHGLGDFEWLEHEFDYFLASLLMEPRDVANTIRNGSIPDWVELLNSTNPRKGQRGKTRRKLAEHPEVVAQIRQGVPGGHGDPDVWVRHAARGFGDDNDQAIASSPAKVREVMKDGYSQVRFGPRWQIGLSAKKDPAKTEVQQRAEMILRYLAAHPEIAALVKEAL